MAEILELTKDISETVEVFPFEDYDRKFPLYKNSQGKDVRESEAWKDFGIKILFPTQTVITHIKSLRNETVLKGGRIVSSNNDPKELAEYFVYHLIKDVLGITENGKPINWADKKWKKWLFKQFMSSAILLTATANAVANVAGYYELKDFQEDEDFLSESDDTLSDTTPESKSKSKAKPEPTAQTGSEAQ